MGVRRVPTYDAGCDWEILSPGLGVPNEGTTCLVTTEVREPDGASHPQRNAWSELRRLGWWILGNWALCPYHRPIILTRWKPEWSRREGELPTWTERDER